MKSCFRGHPLEIRQFQTVYLQKLSHFCGPPRRVARSAKHSRRGRERFPAEKTAAGVPNASPVFRGHPPEIRQFGSNAGQNSRPPPDTCRGSQNTHAGGVRVSQLRKRTPERKIGVWFFGVDPPWNQTVCLQKRSNFAGPSAAFRGPQNTHAEGVRVSQLRKRAPERKIEVLFSGSSP